MRYFSKQLFQIDAEIFYYSLTAHQLAVETDMGISAVLDSIRMDSDYLRRLRADSVKNVKATNGLLTFEQKVREREEIAEGDEQWQD